MRGEEGDQAFYGAYFRDPEGQQILCLSDRPGLSRAAMKVRVIVNRERRHPQAAKATRKQRDRRRLRGAGVDAASAHVESDDIADALAEAAEGAGARRGGGGRRGRHVELRGRRSWPAAAGRWASCRSARSTISPATPAFPPTSTSAAAVIAAGHVRADRRRRGQRPRLRQQQLGRPLSGHGACCAKPQQERLGRGKRLAMLSASLASLRHFRRHRLWISAPGLEERRSARLCCSSATIATR